jgi:DNA-binding MurR/RpiR family transcriptional regulator
MSPNDPPNSEPNAYPGNNLVENLLSRLRSGFRHYTASEKLVASFMLNNLNAIPFETGNSIAAQIGVSEITVGRFCRSLGFPHLRALKIALRQNASTPPWLAESKFDGFVKEKEDTAASRENFDREVKALGLVYQLAALPSWEACVVALSKAPQIWIAGFQVERGLAALFAYELQYMRAGVHLVDDGSGHFADGLISNQDNDCIVIIDTYRYSEQSYRLAAATVKYKKQLVVLTDVQCNWASEFTQNVIKVDVLNMGFWGSNGAFCSMMSLLLNDVVRMIGKGVYNRLEVTSELYRNFTGYFGEASELLSE